MSIESILNSAEIIFWDFDGVIKESDEIKTKIYSDLFSCFGDELTNKVIEHHILNAGVSRFVKIPLYLSWAIGNYDEDLINSFSAKFSEISIELVVKCPWVPGVYEYLARYHLKQKYFLLTGTPHNEIHKILERLNILHFFKGFYGAPFIKSDVLNNLLREENVDAKNCLFIGDSLVDYQAADCNNVPFILRETNSNNKFVMGNKFASFASLMGTHE